MWLSRTALLASPCINAGACTLNELIINLVIFNYELRITNYELFGHRVAELETKVEDLQVLIINQSFRGVNE